MSFVQASLSALDIFYVPILSRTEIEKITEKGKRLKKEKVELEKEIDGLSKQTKEQEEKLSKQIDEVMC